MAKAAPETWLHEAAALMIRERIDLRRAATELEVALAAEEALRIERTKRFKQILEGERQRFYMELAAHPQRNKLTTIGEMLYCIRKLMEESDYDKALEGFFKVAKMEGWVGAETGVNILLGLKPKDIEDAKRTLLEQREPASAATQSPTVN